MEHWLVALGPEPDDAALEWAARHAEGRAGLEVIVSELEAADPRGRILRAADRLEARQVRVPRAFHVVPQFLPEELARCESADLVIVGSAGRQPGAQEADRLLGVIRACRAPVVVVAGGADDDGPPRDIVWAAPRHRPPGALVDAVLSGRESLRVVRSAIPSSPSPRS
jgi:hypothetical protein